MPQKPWEQYAAGSGPWEKYGVATTASNEAPAIGSPEFNRRNALLMMQDKAAAAAPPPSSPSFEWGGLRGLGQAITDIPRSIWELGKAVFTPPATRGEKIAAAATGPIGLAAQRVGAGMVEASKKSYKRAGAAAEEGYPEESVLHATAAALPFIPIEEFLTEGQVDPWAAIFRLAGNTLTGVALARFLPKSRVSAAKRTNKLSFATGETSEASIPKTYTRVLDEIDRTVSGGKRPRTPQDMRVVVNDTLTRLDNKFNTDLQPLAGQNQTPISVSDAIRDKITSAMDQTADGMAVKRVLEDRATEFEKPWTFRALNEERMRLFKLRKEGAGPRAQMRTNADLIADVAAEDALRDLVYDELGSHYGRPGYYADLKSKQSAAHHLEGSTGATCHTSRKPDCCYPWSTMVFKGGLVNLRTSYNWSTRNERSPIANCDSWYTCHA